MPLHRFIGLLRKLSQVANSLNAHRSNRSRLAIWYVVQGFDMSTDSFSRVLASEFLFNKTVELRLGDEAPSNR